jgi:hypothetical protein
MFGAPPTPTPTPTINQSGSPSPGPQAEPSVAAVPATPNASAPGPALPPAAVPAAAGSVPDSRDDLVLGQNQSAMFTDEPAPADPLTIGGQLYLRMQTSARTNQRVENYSLSMPSLLDVFLDARPNERVRGFVLGRMSYDPMQPATQGGLSSNETTAASSGTSGSPSLSSLFSSGSNAPRVLLDQFWLRFDIAHTLFVTAGRQHVRWGTARFWTPTDFLHLRRRNPLDVFDARTGTTMIKVHLPIESNAWNFYAYTVTEGQNGAPSLANVAGAARAEFVLDSTELGLGVFGRAHSRAKFAADLSAGLGDFDVYGELAVLDQRASDRVGYAPDAMLPDAVTDPTSSLSVQDRITQAVDTLYPVYQRRGYRPQAVGGLTYSRKYHDNDVFTIGAEYFYNGFGYSNSDVYPGLSLPTRSLNDPAPFFYVGQHYAALFATFPAPFKLDLHTFTLSTLGNLSDRSFISRLDYSLVLLTHLRFEAFFSVHYGRRSGEFRFGFEPPSAYRSFFPSLPAGLFDLGIALRTSI